MEVSVVMQSELRTEKEFFDWVRTNMAAQFPELGSEETLARIWPHGEASWNVSMCPKPTMPFSARVSTGIKCHQTSQCRRNNGNK
jgi:hypothetical protein